MSSYSVSAFSTLNDGFTTYGTQTWSIVNSHLVRANQTADNPGYYINDTSNELNGCLVVEYDNLAGTDGAEYNGVVLRYIDIYDNLVFRINSRNPGNNDEQFVVVEATEAGLTIATQIPMYDVSGVRIETKPNYVDIPNSGKLSITAKSDYVYDVVIRNTSNQFMCSGTYTDTRSNKSTVGKSGFYHNSQWNGGWNTNTSPYGWKSISWSDAAAAVYAPTIVSYTANPASILDGNSSNICWNITSGGASTSATLNGASISISGCSAVSPTTDTTYDISAWNAAGSTSASLLVDVCDQLPQVIYLSADYLKTTAGQGTYVYWQTNYASSAIFNDELFVYPTSGINTSAYALSTPNVGTKTTYLSAFGPGVQTPAVSAITIETIAQPSIISFTTDSKTCNGVPYSVYWETSAAVSGSLYIVGTESDTIPIPTSAIASGSFSITSAAFTSVENDIWFTAFNELGYSNYSYVAHYVNSYPPTISAEAYVGSDRIINGGTVSITDPSGVDILINTNGTIDPDGDSTTFQYFVNGNLFSSGASTATYTATDANTNDFVVSATDNCGNTTSAGIRIYTTTNVPPMAVISNDDMTIVNPLTITLVGSNSVAYSGKTIQQYVWYTGQNLDQQFASTADVTVTLASPGIYKYKLLVVDSAALIDFSDVLTIVYSGADYDLDADAGDDQIFCGTASSITFDGSNSIGASEYFWDVSEFGVSAIVSAATATVTSVSAGERTAYLTIKNDAGVSDFDYVTATVYDRPTIESVGYVYNSVYYPPSAASFIDVDCDVSFAEVNLSCLCSNYDPSLINAKWEKSGLLWNGSSYVTSYTAIGSDEYTQVISGSNGSIIVSATPQYFQGQPYYQSYRCKTSLIANPNCYVVCDAIPLKVRKISDNLKLNLSVYPQVVNTDGSTYEPIYISWSVSGADNVWIRVDGQFDSVSATDYTMAVVTTSQNIVLSATSGSCSKTISIPVLIKDGTFYSYKSKEDYIAMYAPELMRFGNNRKINLTDFFEYFQGREIYDVVQVFENCLNTLYVGDQGFATSGSGLTIVPTDSADEYLRSQFYKYEEL